MAISTPTRADTALLTQQLFSRRDSIPSRPDILWRIESGVVRTQTWTEEGSLITLGYWGPGDVVGRPLSRVVPYQIECVTKVEVSILPLRLSFQALDAIVLHIQQTEELLSIVHCQLVSLRLWKFLVWLGQKFGRDVEAGRLIDLGLTHQEIAEAISTTRVTVTQRLQQFESEGRLRRAQRRLVLCDTQNRNKSDFAFYPAPL